MTDINISFETNKLINDMGVKIKYYEGRLCSCVGGSDGSYDVNDDCITGIRYKNPVEYRLLRTGIDFRRVPHKLGMILQGGCSLSIPKWQYDHHTVMTGDQDLSSGLDLSINPNIKVSIDGGTEITINCSLKASDKSDVSIDEIIYSINSVGLGEIAYESGSNGDPNDSGYVSIRSLTIGSGSSIDFLKPAMKDASGTILGLNPATYPIRYVPSKTIPQYLAIHDRISRGDVIIVNDRTRRDGIILKKGTLDRIKAFDVIKLISVSITGTIYRENIDFTFDGSLFTWITNLTTGTDYTVEFLTRTNYIVFEELPMDRGADVDIVAKRVHLALRNYVESGLLMNLPIDRGVAFDSGFSSGLQI